MTAQEIRTQAVPTQPRPRFRRRLIGLAVLVAACWGVLLTVLPSAESDPVLVSLSPGDGETVKSPDEVRNGALAVVIVGTGVAFLYRERRRRSDPEEGDGRRDKPARRRLREVAAVSASATVVALAALPGSDLPGSAAPGAQPPIAEGAP